jgi:hypothetical protein
MNIIHHLNTPKEAVDLNGVHVHREEKIFVLELKGFVPTAPYDQHFIFDSGSKVKGQSPFLCTCGSIAVVVGSNVYLKDASPAGMLFVCWHHATYGKHADGSS